jgi:hypothetical protein
MDRVKEMARLTLLSGRISEFHEINMKRYSKIFFNGVTAARIDYDLSMDAGEKRFVHYYLSIDDKFQNDRLEKRFEILENSVRALFWSDLTIRVSINDKLVFESKENERQ